MDQHFWDYYFKQGQEIISPKSYYGGEYGGGGSAGYHGGPGVFVIWWYVN